MTTYSIYFENNYGSTQNFGLFSSLPKVASGGNSSTVYSNIFMAQSVANGGNWTIDITKTYYAWCGTAPTTLQPGVTVANGNGKLVSLGTQSTPGTTVKMINNGGTPAFDSNPTTPTALPSNYEIDTGTDFGPDNHFCMGLGGYDKLGRMQALASWDAPRSARVNIAPVNSFYIAQSAFKAGTVVNTTMFSADPAFIDFTSNPGMYAAIVKQDQNGNFTVNYAPNQLTMLQIVNKAAAPSDSVIKQIMSYVRAIEDLVDNLNFIPAQYVGRVTWTQVPPGQTIQNAITASMQGSGFTLTDTQAGPNQSVNFFFNAPGATLQQATAAWTAAINGLTAQQRQYIGSNAIAPYEQRTKQIEAADGEEDDLSAKKQRALKFLEAEGLNGYADALKA